MTSTATCFHLEKTGPALQDPTGWNLRMRETKKKRNGKMGREGVGTISQQVAVLCGIVVDVF